MNNKKSVSEIIEILANVKFPEYHFAFNTDGGKWYLQGEYEEDDILTGKPELQKTRKWIISPFMTKSEIVQTAFKCALTSMEHRTREHFTYKNHRVFSPHYDVDALVELCQNSRFDERENWYEDEK